ncbi:bacterioferritin-associated ferredoxin [Streptomyces sp. R28]|uniref:Bacterioferritin-associated ferredoxin n=1 Tax=Streptomyces sp. R28 TaxID=3238628 RepID=A0AB39Q0I1_9ACTN
MPDTDDPLICLCRRVRESEILAAAARGCRTLAEAQAPGRAGLTGTSH